MKLKGSTSNNPAIRAAAIASQLQEALWQAGEVPTGEVTIHVNKPDELAELQQFVFGGKSR